MNKNVPDDAQFRAQDAKIEADGREYSEEHVRDELWIEQSILNDLWITEV